MDSDIRITPAWLLDIVREFAGPRGFLDVCTQPDNPTGAKRRFTAKQNALTLSWHASAGGLTAWCNPPYSRGQVKLWASKAAAEAAQGLEILFLTKDDCRTAWNKLLCENTDARVRIDRGVGFLEPDGKGGYAQLVGPMWGSALWYFGRRRRRFDRIFGAIGEVIHGLGPSEALYVRA